MPALMQPAKAPTPMTSGSGSVDMAAINVSDDVDGPSERPTSYFYAQDRREACFHFPYVYPTPSADLSAAAT
jgi:hypothetical protein